MLPTLLPRPEKGLKEAARVLVLVDERPTARRAFLLCVRVVRESIYVHMACGMVPSSDRCWLAQAGGLHSAVEPNMREC